jgi:phage baseplate assembly protein W
LLLSDRGSFFGDPYYGTIIKQLIFEPNNYILRDIVIDAVYTSILQFTPQILVDRKDITITQQGIDIYVVIKATNLLDYQTDMYNINLINYEVT